MVAIGAWKQEELQGGGKSGTLKVSSLLLLLFLFLHFFVMKKMAMMSLSSSFVSSSCFKEEDDNGVLVVFFFFLLQRRQRQHHRAIIVLFWCFVDVRKRWQIAIHNHYVVVLHEKKMTTSMFIIVLYLKLYAWAMKVHCSYSWPNWHNTTMFGWGNDGTNSINFPSYNSILAYSSKTCYCKIKARKM